MAGTVDGWPAHLLGITRVLAGRVVRSVDGTPHVVDLLPTAPKG